MTEVKVGPQESKMSRKRSLAGSSKEEILKNLLVGE